MSAFDPKRTQADRVCCNAHQFSHNELYKGPPLPDSTRAAPRTAMKLRVKSGHDAPKARCPLYPRKRTFGSACWSRWSIASVRWV
jgi:hypothetical protein